MEGVDRRVASALRHEAFALFGADPSDERAGLFIDMSVAILSGLIMARATSYGRRGGRRREDQVLAAWKAAAPTILSQAAVG
jgi:hypothetical protein